jgi:hypothetical protein
MKNTGDIERMLDSLAKKQARLERLENEKNEAVRELIPPKVRKQIDAVEREHKAAAGEVDAAAKLLDAEIRKAVVAVGATIKGAVLTAVFVAPKEKWNADMLRGMAAEHEFIRAAVTVGEASVQIRKANGKKED